MSEYERIRVLWPCHLGLARGKYLPAHLADRGTGHCVTTFALGYDTSLIPAPGAYLLEGLRDITATHDPSSVRPGWEDDTTGVSVAHLTMDDDDYTFSSRYALQQAIAAWEALGYTPKVGIELEGYLLEPDGKGGWRRLHAPRSMVYGTGPGADPSGVIDTIIGKAAASGFKLESMNAEFDQAQYELTLEYDDALAAADDAFLFRILARETALMAGYDFTFLGKPFEGISGSGLHVNFSFVDSDGNNVLADQAAGDGLSALAKSCLAGLVNHHQAMTALCAPTVNAYRRLQPGELSGYWANWGHDHRLAANRVPPQRGMGTRIESRLADGAANIHLAVATVLQAARLGLAHELECPEPLLTDGLEEINTEVHCSESLAGALSDLSADTMLGDAVGRDVVDNFIANKEAEWERYIAAVGTDAGGNAGGNAVTQWELDEYLMFH